MRKFGLGMLSVAALGTLAVMVAGVCGCGGSDELFDKFEVPVFVTLNGAPASEVVVEFHPFTDPNDPPTGKAKAELAMSQPTDAEGKGLIHVAKGKYRVVFRKNEKSGDGEGADASKMIEQMKGTKLSSNQSEGAGKMGFQDSKSLINARYNDPGQTGFEPFEVTESSKEKGFSFDLKD